MSDLAAQLEPRIEQVSEILYSIAQDLDEASDFLGNNDLFMSISAIINQVEQLSDNIEKLGWQDPVHTVKRQRSISSDNLPHAVKRQRSDAKRQRSIRFADMPRLAYFETERPMRPIKRNRADPEETLRHAQEMQRAQQEWERDPQWYAGGGFLPMRCV